MIIELIPAGVTVTAVTGVSVNPATAIIEVPNTQQLTATISPANATNQLVSWSTSNAAVATVSAVGLVTGVGAGTATITVTTADGTKTATSSVKVTAPPPSPWTNADDKDPAWQWSGFSETDCGACYGGTVHYTDKAGSTAQYTFTGTDVEAYCEAWDAAGAVDIYIDGVLKGTYSQEIQPYGGGKIFASFSGLPNSTHIFKAVAKRGYPGIDYIRFKNAAATFWLQLISFTAQLSNGKVNLKWVTQNELNVLRFDIERSADSITFTKIKTVNSKGNGSYDALDDMPITGKNYYRLKIVGKDSTFNYSVVRLIKVVKDGGGVFSVYPNPVKDKLTIIFLPDANAITKVKMINQQGQKVLVKEITGNTPLSIAYLPKGIYMLQLLANGQMKTVKLIKE
jgi:Bacterial Ig-like domain (group 2)/Secretion system C-terminal sorting domain